jgi:hypothetical protein
MPKQRRMKGVQKHGVCVYCGEQGPITQDHVFPEVIFLVLDEQMITVPACSNCQQTKGLGDRDLRNFMIMDIGGSQHPDANEMAARMLKESNVRIRSWVRKQLESAKEVELVTDNGIIVGQAIEFGFNMDRIMVAQEMVVRGLYYHEKGMMLPQDCPVDVQHVPWQTAPKFVQRMSVATSILPKVKGKDVAWWSSHPVPDLPDDATAWVICYNDWVLFFGTTGEVALSVQRQRNAYESPKAEATEVVNAGPRRVVVPRDPEGRPMIPPQ